MLLRLSSQILSGPVTFCPLSNYFLLTHRLFNEDLFIVIFVCNSDRYAYTSEGRLGEDERRES